MKQYMDNSAPLYVTTRLNELGKAELDLLESAIKAMNLSYAPYSEFNVGAAVRMEDGQIILGANQENASYPLCMCAERVALYNASVNAPGKKIDSMAIVAHKEKIVIENPVSPCGACRQVISEYESRQSSGINILLKGDTDKVLKFNSIKELLPLTFDGTYLLSKS